MLMKRRTPPTWLEFIRVSLWPRRSWLRSGQYVTKRVLRLTASPHAVAAGVAVGAFTSFMPYMGFHFLIAAVIAWVFRGNLIASALGTFFGNPISFPFIWAATYQTGHFVLGSTSMADGAPALGEAMKHVLSALWSFDGGDALIALEQIWTPIVWPMTIGGFLCGPLVAIPIYFLTRRAAILFRESRRNKLLKRASEIRDRAKKAAQEAALRNSTSGAET
ncbi:MAG: DUF2062 domain-containing protein [Pseudomonadota bacterium]